MEANLFIYYRILRQILFLWQHILQKKKKHSTADSCTYLGENLFSYLFRFVICCQILFAVRLVVGCPFVLVLNVQNVTAFPLSFCTCMNTHAVKLVHTYDKVIRDVIAEVTERVLNKLRSVQWWKHFKRFYNMPEKKISSVLFLFQEVMCCLFHKRF